MPKATLTASEIARARARIAAARRWREWGLLVGLSVIVIGFAVVLFILVR